MCAFFRIYVVCFVMLCYIMCIYMNCNYKELPMKFDYEKFKRSINPAILSEELDDTLTDENWNDLKQTLREKDIIPEKDIKDLEKTFDRLKQERRLKQLVKEYAEKKKD
jgi:hypothetical protein